MAYLFRLNGKKISHHLHNKTANEYKFNLRHFLIIGFFVCVCTTNHCCEAFVASKEAFVHRGCGSSWLLVPPNRFSSLHISSMNYRRRMVENKNDEDNSLLTYDELSRDPNLLMQSERASDNILNTLTLPNRIGDAITTTGWVFVGVGLLLNINGYGYVVNSEGRITIDTLDNRAFQMEINKGNKRARTGTTASYNTNSPSSASLQHYLKIISANEGNA
mmetsp:Transcript_7206/g.8214  ORF Transcript_7206/g.8214 Transcript_7206/m.8214 type:complete len:219 (-) Transcript_7206:88-744(-)